MKLFPLIEYDYDLPTELIAHAPASPRDSARLFVYDTATDAVTFDIFAHLDKYLPAGAGLVINNTKVVPARLMASKETGGKVELLLLLNEWRLGDLAVRAMVDRKVMVGQKLTVADDFWLTVMGQEANIFTLEPNVPAEELPIWLEQYGTTPVPHYLEPVPLPEVDVRTRYQSMFASVPSSVAAPTASLHFTPEVFSTLETKHIRRLPVTLHVGLGTFAPVTEKNIMEKKLHAEFTEVLAETALGVNNLRASDKKVVAVGTTALRVLESWAKNGTLATGSSFTDIFIMPGHQFQLADGLITNFHLPQSSLMMLVEAFLQDKGAKRSLVELYKLAIAEKFRFYSFGDAMLIL